MWIAIALCGALAAFLVVRGAGGDGLLLVRDRISRFETAADNQLADARVLNITARRLTQLAAVSGLIGFLLAFAISDSLMVSLLVAFVAVSLPQRWLRSQKAKRLALIEQQLPDAIDQLVSSVRAGLSLSHSIEETAGATPRPISEELLQIRNEEKAGLPLSDAIDGARRRIGGRGFPLVTAALMVSIERGGNLPEALDKISESLKEIWRLEQKLITASAESRKAVRVISWMPVFIALLVLLLQPDLASTLVTTVLGWIILALVAVLYTVGLLWLRKLIQPDV